VPAGRVCSEFIATLDLLPTFAALGNAALHHAIDGFDIRSVLLGRPDATSPRRELYSLYGYAKNQRESIREGRWKLHLKQPPELYDLDTDLSESRNVATEHSETVARLTKRAEQLRQETQTVNASTLP
jgi:arylsulfatase A-like enzyme